MSYREKWLTLRRAGLLQVVLARSWIIFGGDQRMRRSVRVPPGKLVLDVGAFRGEFTAFAREQWNAVVIAVEPIPEFADDLANRFSAEEEVTVVKAALGSSNGTVGIVLADDGSSAWAAGGKVHEVPSLDVVDLIGRRKVALMKMNAEGAEFDVLERLLDVGAIEQVATLQVQFHRYPPDARRRRRRIRRSMRRTHRCSWNVPWVWEQWTLRS